MRDWRYKITGLRRHLSGDESPEGIRASATGVGTVLENFIFRHPSLDEYEVEKLREIIEEMRDAGGVGDTDNAPDLEWYNAVLDAMWEWMDANDVWVELDKEDDGGRPTTD